ncbi:MAG: hypothetical protein IOD05_04725 [Rhodobacter sp.]|nr:hypothetical protein [Rhodobacter sp.]
MSNITNIPAPRVPFVDERTGLVSREWFRYLNNQFALTGGGTTSTSIADLELTPSLASTVEDSIPILQSQIDALLEAPARYEPNPINYGQFFDSTTQTAAAINTAYPITFNSSSSAYGVYVDPASTSHIKVTRPAVYNMQFSIQLDKTSGGTGLFWVWGRINGNNIANSASQVRIQNNNGEIFVAANLFVSMSNGDYFQLMWAVDDTTVQLQATAAAGVVPAIPSVILTMTQVYI